MKEYIEEYNVLPCTQPDRVEVLNGYLKFTAFGRLARVNRHT